MDEAMTCETYFLFPEHFALVFLQMTIIAFVQADNTTELQILNQIFALGFLPIFSNCMHANIFWMQSSTFFALYNLQICSNYKSLKWNYLWNADANL